MSLALRMELFPDDLDRFVDFYVGVLRFAIVDDRRENDQPYVAVQRGTIRIGAVPAWTRTDPSTRDLPQGTELVFETDDVEAERNAVVAAGWPLAAGLEKRPWGLTDFRLYDPDGYYIRITNRS